MIQWLELIVAFTILTAGQAFGKVPQLTLERTCQQATHIFIGDVKSIREDAKATNGRWVAIFADMRPLKGASDKTPLPVYFQPGSSVSARFETDKTYVVFGTPYREGLATVNGEGGVFEVKAGLVDDALLVDGVGQISLFEFEKKIRKCASVK